MFKELDHKEPYFIVLMSDKLKYNLIKNNIQALIMYFHHHILFKIHKKYYFKVLIQINILIKFKKILNKKILLENHLFVIHKYRSILNNRNNFINNRNKHLNKKNRDFLQYLIMNFWLK